jgi:hypothetical protein
VPGIENSSEVGPDSVKAPTPSNASAASQSARISLRRRKLNRPSR